MKKLLSILMVLAIVLSLLPMAVFAAENVADFNIDIHPPIIGETPSFELSIPGEAQVNNAKVIWHEVDDEDNFLKELDKGSVFEEGKYYGAEIRFYADDGYSARYTTITINHKVAIGDRTGPEYIAYCKWRALQPISVIEFELDEPMEGEHPDFTAEIPESAKEMYTVQDDLEWGSLTAEDIFVAGETYSVSVHFMAERGYGFTKDCKAMWNGKEAALVIYGNDAYSAGSVVAKEKPSAYYTVTFDVCGHGEAPEPQKVPAGGIATQPLGLKAEGWVFGGWFADKEYTKVFQFNEPINADTTVYAKWTPEVVLVNPFVDVKASDYFYDAVLWAYYAKPQVTNGLDATHFGPSATCTRGQIVTFLWRALGEPAPTITKNPFEDVKESDYFYKAVLWAVEKGVTNGTDATHFSPNASCRREHAVAFLYRAAGKPEYSNKTNPFVDVTSSAYYYDAVLWAVEKNITKGMDATHFGPASACQRSQIVTFLYRFMNP